MRKLFNQLINAFFISIQKIEKFQSQGNKSIFDANFSKDYSIAKFFIVFRHTHYFEYDFGYLNSKMIKNLDLFSIFLKTCKICLFFWFLACWLIIGIYCGRGRCNKKLSFQLVDSLGD
jgi:hypothetical protein